MRQRIIFFSFLLVVIGVGSFLLVTAQKKAPKADVNTYPGLPSKSTATIWGQITQAETKQPAKNMKMTLGSFSLLTDDKGNYLVTTAETGELPLSFEDNTTHEAYEIPAVFEQSVDIEPGVSQHLDFSISKAGRQSSLTEKDFAQTVPQSTPTKK